MPLDTGISSIWRFRGDKEASSVSYNATEMLANQAFWAPGRKEKPSRSLCSLLLKCPQILEFPAFGGSEGTKKPARLRNPSPLATLLILLFPGVAMAYFGRFFGVLRATPKRGKKNKLVARRL